MTQLSNVPMQPNPSAVERPMTLIEKLERELANNSHKFNNWDNGFKAAIAIVKQHQSWRKMPSDEKPQDMQAYNLLLKNDSAGYPTLYSVGLFKEYASGHVWLSLVESETYIDESKILAWQPMNTPSDKIWLALLDTLKNERDRRKAQDDGKI